MTSSEMRPSKNTVKLGAFFAGVAIASAALGFAGARLIKSPAQVEQETAPPPATVLTAPVTRGSISNTLVLAGAISLGNSIPLTPEPPLNGSSAIVTAAPLQVGSKFSPGAEILEISDRPLFVLPSSIPLLRDLTVGSSGDDVRRLQNAFRDAGFADRDKSGVFGPSTATALKDLYQRAGFAPPVEGGKVVLSRAEVALIPMTGSGQVTELGATLGGALQGPAITVTTAAPVVSVKTDPTDAARLAPGRPVEVRTNGSSAKGIIASVGPAAQDGSSGFQAPVIVQVEDGIPAEAIGTTAQVSLNLNQGAATGLLVPVSAIFSDASGASFVSIEKAKKLSRVPVTVAETGDGFARITDVSGVVSVGDRVRVGKPG
jgi:peptidoglycan hydrolase-like protein with peptidoglycan-binding domain